MLLLFFRKIKQAWILHTFCTDIFTWFTIRNFQRGYPGKVHSVPAITTKTLAQRRQSRQGRRFRRTNQETHHDDGWWLLTFNQAVTNNVLAKYFCALATNRIPVRISSSARGTPSRMSLPPMFLATFLRYDPYLLLVIEAQMYCKWDCQSIDPARSCMFL